MQRLTRLELQLGWWFTPSAAVYSALTASSHLQHLDLNGVHPLPTDAWQHMFPAGKTLPHLTHLQYNAWSGGRNAAAAGHACVAKLTSAHLAAMVTCCPNLGTFLAGLQPDVCLAPLQQLSGLQCLSCRSVHPEHLGHIALLTGLQSLHVEGQVSGIDTQPLTALTGLTTLTVSDYVPGVRSTVEFRNSVRGGPHCTITAVQVC